MLLNDIILQLEEKHGCTVGCAIQDVHTGELFADHRRKVVGA